MKLHIQGQGQVDLTQSDFLASGGEGSVYVKGQTAFKVYIDPKKMIPEGKIRELSSLTRPNIIKPSNVLLDAKGKAVGYTMKFVQHTYALCQLFTKSFRDRNNITPPMMLDLVRNLQETVKHVHDQKILIVDLNELNFLATSDFKEVYAIDVDSYQTPSFPATAIMDTIRDRHTKTFSEMTDWFSFAIVSFQMFIGIHPYKGKHPTVKSLEDRMVKNVSVLDGTVGIPAICYPFSVMPPVYLDWYRAVLEDGKRVPPPNDLHAVATLVQTIKKIVGSNNFDLEECGEYKGNIIDVIFSGTEDIVITDRGWETKKSIIPLPAGAVVRTSPKLNFVVAVYVQQGNFKKIFNLSSNQEVYCNTPADSVMKYDGRIYVKTGDKIVEEGMLEDLSFRKVTTLSIPVANVLSGATRMFDGVVFQSLLGSCFASFFPKSGSHQQIRIKELDSYRIVDAKYDNNVLMVIGASNGQYNRFVFRFSDNEYDVKVVPDISPAGLNFITLESGVCIHINEEENVHVFSNKKDSTDVKIFDDPAITSDMKLLKVGGRAMIARGTKLYKFGMKRKP